MTGTESRRDEAARWLAQACRDYNAARLLIAAEPSRSVFHSQQTAEKAAKALLVFHDATFRRTHDLTELGHQCATLEPALEPLFREASDLTEYAVVFRYLDAPRDPDEEEAASALDLALRVLRAVGGRLGLPIPF